MSTQERLALMAAAPGLSRLGRAYDDIGVRAPLDRIVVEITRSGLDELLGTRHVESHGSAR